MRNQDMAFVITNNIQWLQTTFIVPRNKKWMQNTEIENDLYIIHPYNDQQ